MRKVLSVIFVFLFVCLWQGVESYALPCSMSNGTDSIGTGGSLPGMGWGDTANTTAIQKVKTHVDTVICYDLNGKAVKKNSKSIIIKNGKCRIINQ